MPTRSGLRQHTEDAGHWPPHQPSLGFRVESRAGLPQEGGLRVAVHCSIWD